MSFKSSPIQSRTSFKSSPITTCNVSQKLIYLDGLNYGLLLFYSFTPGKSCRYFLCKIICIQLEHILSLYFHGAMLDCSLVVLVNSTDVRS